MKQIMAALVAALMVLITTPSIAVTQSYNLQADKLIGTPLICAEDKKKKGEEEEEEPDCD